MTGPATGGRKGGAGRTSLAIALVLRALAAAFFAGDAVADITVAGLDLHVAIEGVIALALLVGVAFGARDAADEGRARARIRGVRIGRKPKLTLHPLHEAL